MIVSHRPQQFYYVKIPLLVRLLFFSFIVVISWQRHIVVFSINPSLKLYFFLFQIPSCSIWNTIRPVNHYLVLPVTSLYHWSKIVAPPLSKSHAKHWLLSCFPGQIYSLTSGSDWLLVICPSFWLAPCDTTFLLIGRCDCVALVWRHSNEKRVFVTVTDHKNRKFQFLKKFTQKAILWPQ